MKSANELAQRNAEQEKEDLQIDSSATQRSGRNDNGTLAGRSLSPVIPGEVEESLVRDAMERSGGNISAAAKLLGVSRPTLYAKLKKYGL